MTRIRLILLAYFLLLATAFAFTSPVFMAPDEPRHLDFINFVAARGELPNQLDPERSVAIEGNQYPLYYILCAAIDRGIAPQGLIRPTEDAVERGRLAIPPRSSNAFVTPADRTAYYVLRLLAVVLGFVNCLYILALCDYCLPDAADAALAAFLAISLPQFLFLSSIINNDVLANPLCTMTLYYAFRVLRPASRERERPETDTASHKRERPEWSNYLLLGLSFGLAILTKKTALFMAPGIFVLFVVQLWKDPEHRRALLIRMLACGGIVLAVTGWYLVRNIRIYGDPLAGGLEFQLFAHEASLLTTGRHSLFFEYLYTSFVGRFGWMNVTLPGWVYWAYGAFLAMGFVGFLLHWPRATSTAGSLALALLFLGSCLGGVLYWNLFLGQPQGRYLLPVISLTMIGQTMGLRELLRRIPRVALRRLAILSLVFALILLDLASLMCIRQTYAGM